MPLAARIALFPVLVVVNIALAFAFSWIPGLIHPILGWLAFTPAYPSLFPPRVWKDQFGCHHR